MIHGHGSEYLNDTHSRMMSNKNSEAWRYSGPFTRRARFSGTLPGFGIALAAFAGYMVYEQLFMAKAHGHGDAHEESHH